MAVAMARKQLSIAGTEPDRDEVLDGLVEQRRDAAEARKRHAEAERRLEAAIVARMLEKRLARYDAHDGSGAEWALSMSLPTPTLSIKFIGNRDGDEQ